MDTVEFTEDTFTKFKKAYNAAKAENKSEFSFQGHFWLVEYAKYVIEHIEREAVGNDEC